MKTYLALGLMVMAAGPTVRAEGHFLEAPRDYAVVPLEPADDILKGDGPIRAPDFVLWQITCKDRSLPASARPKKSSQVVYGDISMRFKGRLKVTGQKAVLEGGVVEIVGPFSTNLITKRSLPPIAGDVVTEQGRMQFAADIRPADSADFTQLVLDNSGATNPSWIVERKDPGGFSYLSNCQFERAR